MCCWPRARQPRTPRRPTMPPTRHWTRRQPAAPAGGIQARCPGRSQPNEERLIVAAGRHGAGCVGCSTVGSMHHGHRRGLVRDRPRASAQAHGTDRVQAAASAHLCLARIETGDIGHGCICSGRGWTAMMCLRRAAMAGCCAFNVPMATTNGKPIPAQASLRRCRRRGGLVLVGSYKGELLALDRARAASQRWEARSLQRRCAGRCRWWRRHRRRTHRRWQDVRAWPRPTAAANGSIRRSCRC